MKGITITGRFPNVALVCLSLFLSLLAPADSRAEVILQYFGTSWTEIEKRIPEIAERGYDSLWLPPPSKASAGTYSVGFDPLDRFDLGDRDQAGSIPTKYGTKAELLSLVKTAHRFGLRVYFDNVMAHTGGPLDSNVQPGQLFPGIPGFVPEDFHIVRDPTNNVWKKPADWPNWNDEWQVLYRNPFAWDLALESGTNNLSFNPTGLTEGQTFPKWTGIRHPGRPELYLDTDLTVGTDGNGLPLHPFADCEPFQDIGYLKGTVRIGAGNGRFDFEDSNNNGQHDTGETSEPFTDSGVDPLTPGRNTVTWGAGDGKYNMGNPVPENVSEMLHRSARWLLHTLRADGFRLDAVKHVPVDFFGSRDSATKDRSGYGYTGEIQEQFNLTRGFTDWDNHRDTLFASSGSPRNDAFLFGEHLGSPPAEGPYLEAGMRIANDAILNTVKNSIGSNLSGSDQANWGAYGTSSQRVNYVMSHDNNYLWPTDRPAAFAHLLLREGTAIVYTDGYNESTAPDYFPKPAQVSFLGQFSDASVVSALEVNQDFARGTQSPKWQDTNFVAWVREDWSEYKGTNSWNAPTVAFLLARPYQSGGQGRLFASGFPVGATLINHSPHGGNFRVTVNSSGQIVNGSGQAPIVSPGQWFAFGWHNPRLPVVWQGARYQQERSPIEILQNGQKPPLMDHWRTDGTNGDSSFNPYQVPAGDTSSRAYRIRIPRVTVATNLTFRATADGSAENIRLKLDGGIDLNSHLGLGPSSGELRDFPPGATADLHNPTDTVLQTSTDTYLGYEQMRFSRRTAERFAGPTASRSGCGSPGSECYQFTVGSAGLLSLSNTAPVLGNARWVTSVIHDPAATTTGGQPQLSPAPSAAAGQSITLRFRVNDANTNQKSVWVYYTTNGTSYPEGLFGSGKTSTLTTPAVENPPGSGDWQAELPASPAGTVLRYKIGVSRNSAADPVFPFSSADIDMAQQMETVFEIDGFDATRAKVNLHNDYGPVRDGLEEGFHVLRSRAFVGRNDGSSIFRTEVQTFYMDAQPPTGAILYPREGDSVGGTGYGAVIGTDETVTEVWYRIEDSSAANDDPLVGNGASAWAQATFQAVPATLSGTTFTKEWRFTYRNIPASGLATLRIRLKEASSAADLSLSDAEGRFTTLTRTVSTFGPEISVAYPSVNGARIDPGYLLKINFSQALADGTTTAQLLDRFTFTINGAPLAKTGWQVNYGSYGPRGDAHELAIPLPDSLHASADQNHLFRVVYQHPDLLPLEATRTVIANPVTLTIAWPQTSGDRVDDNYTLKAYFSKNLATGLSTSQLLGRFSFAAKGIAQSYPSFSVNYGSFGPGNASHELSVPIPDLYDGSTGTSHLLTVSYTFPSGRSLSATRTVTANPSTRNTLAKFNGLFFTASDPASIKDPGADPDGDGLSNLLEFAQGTNPRAAEPGALGLATTSTNGSFVVRFVTRLGRNYHVEATPDLSLWTKIPGSDRIGNGAESEVTDTNSLQQNRRFYRVQITVP